MAARFDENDYTAPILVALIGLLLMALGRVLQAVDDNLAELEETP